MSQHVTGTQAQCNAWSAAIDADAGCPIRGKTLGGPERVHPSIPGPGWTLTICLPVLAASPGQADLEIPDDVLPRATGRGGLPDRASAVVETALAKPLRDLVYAREGKDSAGNPLPIQAQQQQGKVDVA